VNCVVTTRQLIQTVWGNEDACDAQTVRSHVSHLRHKIERDPTVPQYLLTEPGVGFRLTVPEE
jgi:two-component system, OmpR family, KDP operon response regulator KdpE